MTVGKKPVVNFWCFYRNSSLKNAANWKGASSEWLNSCALLLKKGSRKTIKKINDIKKQIIIVDFSIWNSCSSKEDLCDNNCTKIIIFF